ncbi:phosphopentomutase [Nevskia sp.]|uniref:phosphopentomutase n=1 Tax=Nevskia sp. TaxID=1929292 RepID=UPI0025E75F35|nr:phosphopentomutase [Nevskia sp.]
MACIDRVILVVLDSVGIGAAADAARFGDASANTLKHVAEWYQGKGQPFALPNLERWGLGQIAAVPGVHPVARPQAATATLAALSPGKDTTTGHWEMAGNVLPQEWPLFPQGFDEELMQRWCRDNDLPGWLCNAPASGTAVLDEFGEEHRRTGKPIVYTSGDSVFQVACSEDTFGLDRLYAVCRSARALLDPLGVGRVIARPFIGERAGAYTRTENRRDFSMPPPAPNLLDLLVARQHFVAGIGKIEDIFAHRSVTLVEHTGRNETSLLATSEVMARTAGQRGLIFTNLIDFDQLHGHRRNPGSYGQALMDFDAYLPILEASCGPRDLLMLTADHGNDPTHPGSDHTRENVPLLFWSPAENFRTQDFGRVSGFAAIARLTLDSLGLGGDVARLDGAARSPALAAASGLA